MTLMEMSASPNPTMEWIPTMIGKAMSGKGPPKLMKTATSALAATVVAHETTATDPRYDIRVPGNILVKPRNK